MKAKKKDVPTHKNKGKNRRIINRSRKLRTFKKYFEKYQINTKQKYVCLGINYPKKRRLILDYSPASPNIKMIFEKVYERILALKAAKHVFVFAESETYKRDQLKHKHAKIFVNKQSCQEHQLVQIIFKCLEILANKDNSTNLMNFRKQLNFNLEKIKSLKHLTSHIVKCLQRINSHQDVQPRSNLFRRIAETGSSEEYVSNDDFNEEFLIRKKINEQKLNLEEKANQISIELVELSNENVDLAERIQRIQIKEKYQKENVQKCLENKEILKFLEYQSILIEKQILRESISYILEVEGRGEENEGDVYGFMIFEQCYPTVKMTSQRIIDLIGKEFYYDKKKQLEKNMTKAQCHLNSRGVGEKLKNKHFAVCHMCLQPLWEKYFFKCKKSISSCQRQQSFTLCDPLLYYKRAHQFNFFQKVDPLIHPYFKSYIQAPYSNLKYYCQRAYCYDCLIKFHQEDCFFCTGACTCTRCRQMDKLIKLVACYQKYGGNPHQIYQKFAMNNIFESDWSKKNSVRSLDKEWQLLKYINSNIQINNKESDVLEQFKPIRFRIKIQLLKENEGIQHKLLDFTHLRMQNLSLSSKENLALLND